ncbi:hypothetical protein MSG28_012504 [Choristoneura fumiferana]|uniref:Uncharacterized protein n=1 Tax=Choristoneura fumiferana TaxID=7141 RepID=A0ACC0KE15_CHOFU|nr:hypothetical protein MSG28_012504 [Choristoneura fumiferana]
MILNSKGLVLIFGLMELGWSEDVSNSSGSRVLSRKRRYVTFPEGSSFSCAACMTVGLIGQPAPSSSPGTFTFGLNWGIAYELPNATETLAFYRKRRGETHAQRRSRRELYGKIEDILDNMGYNGRQCILKTLCETTQRMVPHGDNMIEEMFRTLFTTLDMKSFIRALSPRSTDASGDPRTDALSQRIAFAVQRGTFTFGLNWGIAYELPNATETLAFYHKKKGRKPMAQRRSRRELYGKIEDILDNMGYSGRQCILKTLCETTQRIVPHGNNMVEEIFRLCSRYHYPKCFLKNRWSIPYTMQHIAWELYWKIVTFTNVPCP